VCVRTLIEVKPAGASGSVELWSRPAGGIDADVTGIGCSCLSSGPIQGCGPSG